MIPRLELQLKSLSLTEILAHYREEAHKAAQEKLSYENYLARLVEMEAMNKLDRSITAKIHKARFPSVKTLEEFDFSFQPQLNEKEIIRLASLDFIEKKENLLFLGPPAVGKTHLAIAFGVKACMAKYRVFFIRSQDLLANLSVAHKTGRLGQVLLNLSRLNLLILGELGYLPISSEQANLLFQLVSIRYEKGALILTSNYGFEEWGPIFTDQVIAAAIIDRLVHHSHIFVINGNSFRMKQKLLSEAA
ncbi:MAG: IS21-like element helper ATPase IstB [Desulfobacca sp.]|uniref:IS21-like element helper ATPase IstB n=1 Tax=Desulfobacca sp. TaxID=2067990 RepID=UPI0040494339